MSLRLILTLSLFFFVPFLAAQNTNLLFRHLTMDDGLADGWVHDMIMDSQGLIWFATHDGISRYDGHHFKNYKHNPSDTTSLPGPVSMCIREGEKGVYWIASNGIGLVRFDSKKETFRAYRHIEDDSTSLSHIAATTLCFDSDQELWVGTFGSGFNHFHKQTGTFSRFSLPDTAYDAAQSFMLNSVRQILNDPLDAEKLWIVSHQGLYHFHKKTGEKTHYPLLRWGNPAFGVSALIDSTGLIWVGTENHGLVQFDSRTKAVSFLSDPMQAKNVYRKSPNELWVSTIGKGLGIYHLDTKNWEYITTENSRKHGILSNDIYGLYVDKEERLWVRDVHLGVSVSIGTETLFQKATMPEHVSLNLWGTKKFSYDSVHHLLFAASLDNHYLFCFEEKMGTYVFSKTAQFVDYQDVEGLKLLDVYSASEGKTYVLMKDEAALKLFEYEIQYGVLQEISVPYFTEINANRLDFCTIQEDRNSVLWIAFPNGTLLGMQDGAYIKKHIGKNLSKGKNPEIWDILFDSDNELWACSLADGVFRLNLNTNKETHYAYDLEDGLHAWRILALTQLKNGKIWVGSSAAGIQELDPTLPVIQYMPTFNQRNGLPDDKISKLSTDVQGNVWISTNRGLVRYNPKTEQFRKFGETEGLENTFLTYGSEQISNGDILLGLPMGFQYISPRNAMEKTASRPAFFTKIMVNGSPYKSDSLLEVVEHIDLEPDENYFTVYFSARYFDNAEQVKYRYILEGYDPDWIETKPGVAYAQFSNVTAGTYTLKVLAANSDGYWNTRASEVVLTVHPHWYWSIWAKLFYTLVGAGIIMAFVSVLRRRRRLQQELALEKIEVENVRKMEQLKSEMLAQSERLLLNILPADIAQELKEKGRVEPRVLNQSTILFLDFKDFTSICKQLTAKELIEILSTVFGKIDSILSLYALERIKTIGDAYMAFGGMSESGNVQAAAMLRAAFDMLRFLEQWNKENPQFPNFEARIGIHAGPITAGVVGHQKFAFDIWGEAVNMASRMESYGAPNRINISASFKDLVASDFDFEQREPIHVKGLGTVEMYYVLGEKSV